MEQSDDSAESSNNLEAMISSVVGITAIQNAAMACEPNYPKPLNILTSLLHRATSSSI